MTESRAVERNLTGLPDTDRLILMGLDDTSHKSACSSSEYMSSLCDNTFWRRRFATEYVDLGFPARSFDYRKAYWELKSSKESTDLFYYALEHDLVELYKLDRRNRPSYYSERPTWQHIDTAILFKALNILTFLVEESNYRFTPKEMEKVRAPTTIPVLDYMISKGLGVIESEQDLLLTAIHTDLLDLFEHVVDVLVHKTSSSFLSQLSRYLVPAAQNGRIEIVKYILRKATPIDQEHLDQALYYATMRGHDDIVALLIKEGANLNANDAEAFMQAARGSDTINRVRLFIQAEKPVDLDRYGPPALKKAIANLNVEIVDYLLTLGVRLSVEELEEVYSHLSTYYKPNHYAYGSVLAIKRLLERYQPNDVPEKTPSHQTPKTSPRRTSSATTSGDVLLGRRNRHLLLRHPRLRQGLRRNNAPLTLRQVLGVRSTL